MEGQQEIPYNLLALAGPLEAAGYAPVIIDAAVDPDYAAKVLEVLPNILFVGISSMTGFQIAEGLALADLVAEHAPDVPRVWGGVHPSLLPEETIADGRVDVVVMGQGEETVVEIASALDEGRGLAGIKGVVYKKDGRVVNNGPRKWLRAERLIRYPFHLIDLNTYVRSVDHVGHRLLDYISSYGCPYDCGFCASSTLCGRHWTGLSPETVLGDIEYLRQHADIDSITFHDMDFFVNKKRVRAILEGLVERKIDINWCAWARIDELLRFDDSLWRLMRDTNCRMLLVGVESGDQEALDFIGKGITVKDTIAFLKRSRKWSIPLECGLMLGFPLNPEKEFWETVKLINHILKIDPENFRFAAGYYLPYPGSRLYAVAIERGFEPPSSLAGWSNFVLKKPHTLWVSQRLIDWNEFVIKHVYHYAYGPDVKKSYIDSGRPVALYYVQHVLSLLRWRLRFFRWPVELKLKEFLATLRRTSCA